MNEPQLTTLLPNAVLDRLHRLRIVPVSRRTNRGRGEHLAGKGGTSTEFCDYRDYAPGDDFRRVDWNIFARLNRPYIKQFHTEEERHVVLLVDSSASMQFEQKHERARQLAAAFGVLGLLNHERVSIYDMHRRLAPCTGRASLRRMFEFIEQTQTGGATSLEAGIESLLKLHRGRGVCVLLSDFLSFDDLARGFNLLYATGLEIFGIQILAPSEIAPEVTGDLRLVDSETEQALDITSAGDLLSLYAEYRESYEQRLSSLCQRRAGRFVSISADAPLEWVLFDVLRRKGWIE